MRRSWAYIVVIMREVRLATSLIDYCYVYLSDPQHTRIPRAIMRRSLQCTFRQRPEAVAAIIVVLLGACLPPTSAQKQQLIRIFQNCHRRSPDFDTCIKSAFNELIAFYKTGKFAITIGGQIEGDTLANGFCYTRRYSRTRYRTL